MDPVVGAGVLSAVPTAACLAFHQSLGTLTDDVNRTLEGRPDLAGLIGADNLELMRDNHANHASFMDNVFFLANFNLLARMAPWVYRVYTARGFSLDYFPVELQAWSDAIGNRLPSHLSEPILAVYAWMIRHHDDFAEQACLPDAAAPSTVLSVGLDRFVAVFLDGDFKAAERLTREALGESPDLEEFYLWILDPVMREIGRRWEHSLVSSAQEHVASALVTRMMSVAYARIDRDPALGKRVVACSGPHEQHQIGAWMVSDLLEARGWDARLLGADPSADGLLKLLDEFRPAVLALSVTVPFHLRDAAQLIAAVRRRPGLEDLRIMVGGQAFAMDAGLAKAIGADGYAPDARSAALLAEGWWEEAQR
jgi:methanogenic corrinoid protein MtbC1